MVVFGVVCVKMLPMRKIILSDNQVIFLLLFFGVFFLREKPSNET